MKTTTKQLTFEKKLIKIPTKRDLTSKVKTIEVEAEVAECGLAFHNTIYEYSFHHHCFFTVTHIATGLSIYQYFYTTGQCKKFIQLFYEAALERGINLKSDFGVKHPKKSAVGVPQPLAALKGSFKELVAKAKEGTGG